MSNVRHLRLSRCEFGTNTFDWLKTFPLLTSLDVSNNKLSYYSSMQLFKVIESLTGLKVLNMSQIRNQDIKFLKLVKSSQLKQLTHLDMSFSIENSYALSRILLAIADNENLSNLTSLNTFTEFTDEYSDIELAVTKVLQSPHLQKLTKFSHSLNQFYTCSVDACVSLTNNRLFKYIPKEVLMSMKPAIKSALETDGLLLQYTPKEIRNDREMALLAIHNNELAFKYASYDLHNDKELVMQVVRKNGRLLQHVSKALRNDREVVMAAVNHWGKSIQYASEKLRCDKEIATIALSKTREVLDFIPEDLFSPTEVEQIVEH